MAKISQEDFRKQLVSAYENGVAISVMEEAIKELADAEEQRNEIKNHFSDLIQRLNERRFPPEIVSVAEKALKEAKEVAYLIFISSHSLCAKNGV